MSQIHPLAYVEEGATIGSDVTIEAFAVVKKDVILKDHVTIKSHAYIEGFTTIDEYSVIWPGAVIGTKTPDLKYHGEKTTVFIGKHCEIREYATINSSCGEGTSVRIGDHCLIMKYCHVAHNCEIGHHVIIANNTQLAGHVIVEDYVVIGGMTPVHQFCRIGTHSMVGGFSGIGRDVPPYTIGTGHPYRLGGLNLVGLKRRGFSPEVRSALFQAFRLTYRMGLPLKEALERIASEVTPLPEVKNWLNFCTHSKRGLIGFDVKPAVQENVVVEAL